MLRASAAFVGALLLNVGLAAEEPAGPLDRIDKAMLAIGAQIRNAEVRVDRGLKDVSREGTTAAAGYSSLAVECCRGNVEQIQVQMKTVQGLLEELRRHYSGQQDRTALGLLDQMDARLRQLAEGTMSFVRAPDRDLAKNALLGAVRPWNEFRNGIEGLERCCPIVENPGVQLAPTPPPPSLEPSEPSEPSKKGHDD